MIQKLRLKFVAICMVLMTAVLGIVFASFYISAQWNIERSSMEVLQRVIQQDSYGCLLYTSISATHIRTNSSSA